MKYPELTEYGCPVVVYFFAGEPVLLVEGVNAAQRKLDAAARGGKSAPRSQVASSNDHLKDDGVLARMPVPDIDLQVRQRSEQLRVEGADLLAADVMGIPWRVIVPRCFPK